MGYCQGSLSQPLCYPEDLPPASLSASQLTDGKRDDGSSCEYFMSEREADLTPEITQAVCFPNKHYNILDLGVVSIYRRIYLI